MYNENRMSNMRVMGNSRRVSDTFMVTEAMIGD